MCQAKSMDDFHTLEPDYETSGKEGSKMFKAKNRALLRTDFMDQK